MYPYLSFRHRTYHFWCCLLLNYVEMFWALRILVFSWEGSWLLPILNLPGDLQSDIIEAFNTTLRNVDD